MTPARLDPSTTPRAYARGVRWHGWLYNRTTADLYARAPLPRPLAAYAPTMLDGEWGSRSPVYVRDSGKRGPAQWQVVCYGEVVGAERTKGEAQHAALALLDEPVSVSRRYPV